VLKAFAGPKGLGGCGDKSAAGEVFRPVAGQPLEPSEVVRLKGLGAFDLDGLEFPGRFDDQIDLETVLGAKEGQRCHLAEMQESFQNISDDHGLEEVAELRAAMEGFRIMQSHEIGSQRGIEKIQFGAFHQTFSKVPEKGRKKEYLPSALQ